MRRKDPLLFEQGDYLPLKVHGAGREHLVAYARRTRTSMLVVLATRLYTGLLGKPGAPMTGEACWTDTTVDISPLIDGRMGHLTVLQAEDVLTGLQHALTKPGVADNGQLRVAELFTSLPGAALWVAPSNPG